ncbi:hypothetical protein WJX84_000601 [Apatococcus fuscideae]|uniref:Pop1 N-terminal domain-containing protein n=1 Tax=Apatococcus fuscideae TaxID=2026836 RepID=A0AAW1SL11_9CHLO
MAGEESVPRVLEVQKFVGAREIEVKSLKTVLTDPDNPNAAWGEGALPGHLRRRTASHKRYQSTRRPNHKLQSARQAKEVHSQDGPEEGQALKLLNRRMRRKRSWLQAAAESSSGQLAEQLPSDIVPSMHDKQCRLETHLWHAKRFRMAHRWAHVLAEGEVGAGQGSHSLISKLKTGCILHDASYHVPLEISATRSDLSALLLTVSPAGDMRTALDGQSFWRGRQELEVLLHHPGSQPMRALCPAHVLCSPGPGLAPHVDLSKTAVCIWVHPAALPEAQLVLQRLCNHHHAELISRAGQLRRIELRGPRTLHVLSKALPLLCKPTSSMQHQEFAAQQPKLPQQLQQDSLMAEVGMVIERPQENCQGLGLESTPGLIIKPATGNEKDRHGKEDGVQCADEAIWRALQRTDGSGSVLPRGAALLLTCHDPRLAKPITPSLGSMTMEHATPDPSNPGVSSPTSWRSLLATAGVATLPKTRISPGHHEGQQAAGNMFPWPQSTPQRAPNASVNPPSSGAAPLHEGKLSDIAAASSHTWPGWPALLKCGRPMREQDVAEKRRIDRLQSLWLQPPQSAGPPTSGVSPRHPP